MLVDQLLVEMLRRETLVARLKQIQHPRHLVYRCAARRNPAQAPVIKTLRTLRRETVPPAPERSLRHPQNLRRFSLTQNIPACPLVNLFELHQS